MGRGPTQAMTTNLRPAAIVFYVFAALFAAMGVTFVAIFAAVPAARSAAIPLIILGFGGGPLIAVMGYDVNRQARGE